MRNLFCGIYEEKNELLSELKTRPHITQKIYIYLKELIEKEKKEKSTNELEQMWVEKFSKKAKDRQEDFNNTQVLLFYCSIVPIVLLFPKFKGQIVSAPSISTYSP